MVAASKLPIQTNASAMQMAEEIFGNGINILNASYSGDNASSGIYSNGDTVSPYATPGDTGIILSTGRAKSFTNRNGEANQRTDTSRNTNGVNNDQDFNDLAGASTYDASILDVDFEAAEDGFLSMQFVFSSEEYPEYSNSIYNDVVGVWINGQQVQLGVASGTTSVGNVNDTSNLNLYNDNTSDAYNTEMDGFTVTLTLKIPVTAGVNSLRIGIADVGDSSYDSNLLIAGGSLQSSLVATDDSTNIGIGGTKTIDVLDNDANSTGGTLTITQINGVAASVGVPITLATGQVITLNADGTFTIQTDADIEATNFTYTVESSTGESDIGFVTVNTIPCFVAGTRIRTPDGEVAVDTLEPGDMVLTHDNGPQPVRWIGRRTVRAIGDFAPIHISAGVFGKHNALKVSPQHRILISDVLAELLFGEGEVLVAAKDLVNDHTIRRREGGTVDYVHILFDEHQVVYSEGLATESFLPGPQTTKSFEQEIVKEICSIFPEIDPATGLGYSASARRTLRGFEAQVLFSRGAAA